jgi:hypothetical protein
MKNRKHQYGFVRGGKNQGQGKGHGYGTIEGQNSGEGCPMGHDVQYQYPPIMFKYEEDCKKRFMHHVTTESGAGVGAGAGDWLGIGWGFGTHYGNNTDDGKGVG